MPLSGGRFVSRQVGELVSTSSQRGFPSRNVAAAGATGFTPLHLPGLQLWIDPSDASTVTISASSGAYINADGLVLSGSGTNHATSIDTAAVRPTGDFTLVADITATDWTPAADSHIASSGNTGTTSNINWYLYLDTSGNLVLSRPTGSTARVYTSTSATGVSDGTRKKIKVTFDVDNGASASEVRFYLSDDGTTWSQLGNAVTNASTAAGNSNTTAPRIGLNSANGANFTGTIHRVAVWSDLTSTTKVMDFDFEAATPYVSAFTGSALGMPVYVVSSTAQSSTATYAYIAPDGFVAPGATSNYARALDINAYDATSEAEIVARASLIDWTPAAVCTVLDHINASTGLRLDVSTDGTLKLVTNAATSTSTVATSFTDGVTYWIKATYSDAADEVKFFWAADSATEPSSWTQLGTTVTQTSALSASTNAVLIGLSNADTQPWSGTIKRAILRTAIGGTAVLDVDFVGALDYAGTFKESSSNAATITIIAGNRPMNAAGASVSQVTDKSGQARTVSQATLASMPRLFGLFADRPPVIVMYGGDEVATASVDMTTWFDDGRSTTMAYAIRTGWDTDRLSQFGTSVVSGPRAQVDARGGNANYYDIGSTSPDGDRRLSGADGITTSSMNVMVVVRNRGLMFVRRNGTQVLSKTGMTNVVSSGSSATYRLGSNADPQTYDGALLEFCAFAGPLTDQQVRTLEMYMNAKWGVY